MKPSAEIRVISVICRPIIVYEYAAWRRWRSRMLLLFIICFALSGLGLWQPFLLVIFNPAFSRIQHRNRRDLAAKTDITEREHLDWRYFQVK